METVSAASRTRLQGPADALVARRAPRVAPSALGQPPELGQGGWGRGGALGGCPEAPDAVPALGRPVGDAQVGGEVAGPCELLDAQVAGVLHPERPVHLHVPVQAAPRSKCPVACAAVWRGRFPARHCLHFQSDCDALSTLASTGTTYRLAPGHFQFAFTVNDLISAETRLLQILQPENYFENLVSQYVALPEVTNTLNMTSKRKILCSQNIPKTYAFLNLQNIETRKIQLFTVLFHFL